MAALAIDFEGALSDSSGLDERLVAILAGGFVERTGWIVFSNEAGSLEGLGRFFDETDLEASLNHIHIDHELVDAAPSEIRHQQHSSSDGFAKSFGARIRRGRSS